jgi:methylglutaconyl-CoA hydratase
VYKTIETALEGSVATVALNRPNVRNAFNAEMGTELRDEFGRLAGDSRVRVVVLRGNGPCFSAGADVNWMRASLDYSQEENVADTEQMSDMFASIAHLPKPVICRVHGAALGGGMGLMAACDIAIAAEGATFGFTEAKLGIIPAVISRFVIPKIGETWARALYLSAERFGPELARQIGLVHWVCPVEKLDALVAEKTRELLSSAPGAVGEAKVFIAELARREPGEIRRFTAQTIARMRAAPEGQEGLKAFLDKRQPSWSDVP